MRCVKKDQTQSVSVSLMINSLFNVSFQNMTLHYCSNGSLTLAFARNKEVFYMSIVYILKVSHGHNVHYQGRGRERRRINFIFTFHISHYFPLGFNVCY